LNGELLTIMLLYSLPDSFENFRCAMETRDTLPDAESMKVKIIEEHNARQRRTNQPESSAMFAKSRQTKDKSSSKGKAEAANTKNKKKPNYNCGYCDIKGHKKSNCFKKKKDKKEQLSQGNQTKDDNQKANYVDESFFVNCPRVNVDRRVWCIDRMHYSLM